MVTDTVMTKIITVVADHAELTHATEHFALYVSGMRHNNIHYVNSLLHSMYQYDK